MTDKSFSEEFTSQSGCPKKGCNGAIFLDSCVNENRCTNVMCNWNENPRKVYWD